MFTAQLVIENTRRASLLQHLIALAAVHGIRTMNGYEDLVCNQSLIWRQDNQQNVTQLNSIWSVTAELLTSFFLLFSVHFENLASCHFVNLPFYSIPILSTHYVKIMFCQQTNKPDFNIDWLIKNSSRVDEMAPLFKRLDKMERWWNDVTPKI